MKPAFFIATLLVLSACLFTAANAQVVITQQKALQGNVTPGDTAGFPITLSVSGSYILESDLNVPANRNGIVVKAHDITIDLNGFRIYGGGKATNGILGVANINSATIKNGGIIDFKSSGINADEGDYWSLDNLRIVVNGAHGALGRNLWTVRDSQVDSNGGSGIFVQSYANILESTIAANGAFGIACERDCLVENNNISKNRLGISIRNGTIVGNTITENFDLGISVLINGYVGYGNNTLFGNNGGGTQTSAGGATLVPLQPNACQAC